MTPCEKLGYKVGDKFLAKSDSFFPAGTEITLNRDDGTDCPLFAGPDCGWDNAKDDDGVSIEGCYEILDAVEPVKGDK